MLPTSSKHLTQAPPPPPAMKPVILDLQVIRTF